MNASQKRRLEKLERALAVPSAPPPFDFHIADVVNLPLPMQVAYQEAVESGDDAFANAMLERWCGVPLPVRGPRRRRSSNRPPRITTLIITGDLSEPIDLDLDRETDPPRPPVAPPDVGDAERERQTAMTANPSGVTDFAPAGRTVARVDR